MADYTKQPFGPMTDYYSPNGNPYVTQYQGAVNPNEQPLRPEFVSIGDPTTGLLQSPYMQRSELNTQALEALRKQALDTGPSKWRQLAQAQAGDTLAKQQAGQLAQARSQLAMSGGLRSGARERLASQALQGGLAARQGVYSQLAMQDEQNRQAALKALPGLETQQAQYTSGIQAQNIDRARQEIAQKRLADMGVYSEGMKAWAAQQMANAVPAAAQGGGLLGMGGFLGTGVGAPGGVLGTGWGGGGMTKGGTSGYGVVGDVMSAPVSVPVAIGNVLGGGGK